MKINFYSSVGEIICAQFCYSRKEFDGFHKNIRVCLKKCVICKKNHWYQCILLCRYNSGLLLATIQIKKYTPNTNTIVKYWKNHVSCILYLFISQRLTNSISQNLHYTLNKQLFI